MDSEKVVHLVNEALAENDSLFLIDLKISPDNKIKVIVDGDQGIPLNECIRISRHVEHNLDRENEDFALEVTSADITEPLVHVRQYQKNIGRAMKIKTGEKTEEGVLKSIDENQLVLTQTIREPKPIGKGKITVERDLSILLENIKEAKVKIFI